MVDYCRDCGYLDTPFFVIRVSKRRRAALVPYGTAVTADWGRALVFEPGPDLMLETVKRMGYAIERQMEVDALGILKRAGFAHAVGEPVVVEQARCQGCGAPIPVAGWCKYCDHKRCHQETRWRTDALPGNVAARTRMATFDRKQRPRVTAESRELAKAHPWECQDD